MSKNFKPGTRVIHESGEAGTVRSVGDDGEIAVTWDDGYDEDGLYTYSPDEFDNEGGQ